VRQIGISIQLLKTTREWKACIYLSLRFIQEPKALTIFVSQDKRSFFPDYLLNYYFLLVSVAKNRFNGLQIKPISFERWL